ncbi:MAG: tetratricopeptide repeat protein, partial [Pseudomonadota bacterium]
MPSYQENLVRAANELNSGQLDQAGARLDRMIDEHPQEAPAYNLRAVLRKAQANLPGALEDAQKAAELEPENLQFLTNIGTLQLLQGDPDAALEQFGKAIAKDPEFALARRNRGLLLLGLEQFAEAVEDLKVAAQQEPKRAATRTAYADALIETNALNPALEELRAANALQETQTPQWQSVWGRLMYRSGRLPDARDAFTAAILAQPSEIRHYVGLAATHYHEGDANQARKITHAALKKSPTTVRSDGEPELRVLVLETLGEECFSALPGRAFNHTRGHFVALIPPGRIAYAHAITDHLESLDGFPDLDRYDLVYNNHAVHETTVQLGLTDQLATLIDGIEQPVINAPAGVAETTRLANAEKF